MTNITKMVMGFLDHDIAIKRDLGREIINKRALAQYIQKHLYLNGNIDGLVCKFH